MIEHVTVTTSNFFFLSLILSFLNSLFSLTILRQRNIGLKLINFLSLVKLTEKQCLSIIIFTGWGDPFAPGYVTSKLQQTTLRIVNYTKCWQKNSKITPLTDNMFCAAIIKPLLKVNSACHGDSGGGFVCMNKGSWKLEGVVSWGSEFCNTTDAYTVFANVSRFRLWIDKYVKSKKKIVFTR